MSGDVYAALSGATACWAQLEVTANNAANVSTTGYKAVRLTFSLAGPDEEHGQVYAQATPVRPDMSDGAIVRDDDPTHLALQGQGFFQVQGPDGQTLLTRDGRFHLDADGQLVNSSGMLVLGQGGPVTVPPGEGLHITSEGRVFGSTSGELDQLSVVVGEVLPYGENLWQPTGPMGSSEAEVLQGALEGSNVDPMKAMVELMEASRYFQAYQKAMQTSDEADERMNRSGGR